MWCMCYFHTGTENRPFVTLHPLFPVGSKYGGRILKHQSPMTQVAWISESHVEDDGEAMEIHPTCRGF